MSLLLLVGFVVVANAVLERDNALQRTLQAEASAHSSEATFEAKAARLQNMCTEKVLAVHSITIVSEHCCCCNQSSWCA